VVRTDIADSRFPTSYSLVGRGTNILVEYNASNLNAAVGQARSHIDAEKKQVTEDRSR
jgi:hypothetical protein